MNNALLSQFTDLIATNMYMSIKIQHGEKLISDELIIVISQETLKSTNLANVNLPKTRFVVKEPALHIFWFPKVSLFWLNQVGISA